MITREMNRREIWAAPYIKTAKELYARYWEKEAEL